MKYEKHGSVLQSNTAFWALIFGLLMVLMYIISTIESNSFEEKFKQHDANYRYNYCAGVFTFGEANAELGDQAYTFSRAVDWFQRRSEETGGVDKDIAKVAIDHLTDLADNGEKNEFEDIGSVCADIVIEEKK